MKYVGLLLLVGALAALVVFLWPLLRPQTARGPRPETFSTERSRAVAAAAQNPRRAAEAAPPATPPAGPDASPPQPAPPPAPGPLCDRAFAGAEARPVALPGGTWLRRATEPRGSAWTWVNVWAAWCKPCKEEMPLLGRAFAGGRAAGAGGAVPAVRVLFLSVDDDERELRRYMDGEGRSIPGEFLWVADETARAPFFAALGFAGMPTLPVQALLDPRGRLRCVRAGSVGEHDLAQARRLMTAPTESVAP